LRNFFSKKPTKKGSSGNFIADPSLRSTANHRLRRKTFAKITVSRLFALYEARPRNNARTTKKHSYLGRLVFEDRTLPYIFTQIKKFVKGQSRALFHVHQ
jgi:hypothetical protein